MVVAHNRAICQYHLMMIRLNRADRILDPGGPHRHQASHGAAGGRVGKHAAAHQGPAGLVVMEFGRLDHRDVEAVVQT
jgi:hypothetical protein